MNPGLTATLTQPAKGPNRSVELVRPTDGLVYSDAGTFFTTGMGMHGAAGERELHNFGGASGPDFKQDFVDTLPTANTDIAPTIGALLGVRQPAAATGRLLSEAFSTDGAAGARYLASGPQPEHAVFARPPSPLTLTTTLSTSGAALVTSLHVTRFHNLIYLDSSDITRSIP